MSALKKCLAVGGTFLYATLGFSLFLAPTDRDHAAARKAPPTSFECRFTELPIKIDGNGNDAAWKHAQTIDHFYLPWLGARARPARTATRAKLLWDREYLYFLADMEDADLYADARQRDGLNWKHDTFALFVRPAANKSGYYQFQVDPAGAVLAVFHPSRGAESGRRPGKDSDFHVEAKVHLRGTLNQRTDRDEGWTVEGKIPWKALVPTGGRPEPGETWKFALCRQDYSADAREPELSTCAPLKGRVTADFHDLDNYATLKFVGPAQSAGALAHGIERWTPVAGCRVVGSPEPPNPFRIRRVYPELNITYPIAVRHQPGSDLLLVVQQPSPGGASRIVRFKDDPRVKDLEPLLTLDGTAYDVVFHPDFKSNGYFYVGYKGPAAGPSAAKRARVTRFTMDRQVPFKVDPASAKVIIEWPSDGHDGLGMGFCQDGMFYVTTGDGTSDSDTNVVGQDMTSLLAKVLRIDIDHPDPGKAYSVPKDNPFVGLKGARPEIWALGLRNPWRRQWTRKPATSGWARTGRTSTNKRSSSRKATTTAGASTKAAIRFIPGGPRGRTS
jgi:hypothetical protein